MIQVGAGPGGGLQAEPLLQARSAVNSAQGLTQLSRRSLQGWRLQPLWAELPCRSLSWDVKVVGGKGITEMSQRARVTSLSGFLSYQHLLKPGGQQFWQVLAKSRENAH